MSISKLAIHRGHALGFTEKDIEVMVDRAARYSHPIGNLRFMEWWFLVEKGTVHSMGRFGPKSSGVKVIFPDATSCTFCRGAMLLAELLDDKTESLKPCPRMANRELELCGKK